MAHHVHAQIGDVWRKTAPIPDDLPEVKGYDFNQGIDYPALLKSYATTGFQATHYGLAVKQINGMIEKRQQPLAVQKGYIEDDPSVCPCQQSCTVFLSYTSNLISSGVRESIRYLAEHKQVDILVTTAGGIEEDLIKCLSPMYIGDFRMPGKELFKKGMNRTGNTLMPEENYVKFEKWILPVFEKMLQEQETQGVRWTPSKMIARFGKEIDNPESVYYWAYKNNIKVFSPALTDGAIGDLLYIFSKKNPSFVLDVIEDIAKINKLVEAANCTGIICLGGGVAKHHVLNANSWRDGADFTVFVNTAQEFDGCDSGARPDEAVSWGKVRADTKPVKVFADATLVFPLLVSETFALNVNKKTAVKNKE